MHLKSENQISPHQNAENGAITCTGMMQKTGFAPLALACRTEQFLQTSTGTGIVQSQSVQTTRKQVIELRIKELRLLSMACATPLWRARTDED